MKSNQLTITIKVNHKITLWEAIKLRIAGSNYKAIADELIRQVKINMYTTGLPAQNYRTHFNLN